MRGSPSGSQPIGLTGAKIVRISAGKVSTWSGLIAIHVGHYGYREKDLSTSHFSRQPFFSIASDTAQMFT